ncbi:MAG: YraN family protein [Candidatus Brocadiia bacterium]
MVLKWLRRLAGLGDETDGTTTETGRRAEQAAARHLRRNGYRILTRNFHTRRGEIDIIAFRDGTVAFVEVRSLTRPAMGDPLDTINRGKQRHIVQAAREYCTAHGLYNEQIALRFDVVAVTLDQGGRPEQVRHVVNAFEAP